MHKVVVFGAGIYAKSIAKKSLNELADYEIVAFIDNDESKQGKFFKINNDKSIKIYSVDILKNIEFDRIIITTYTGYNEVTKQLLQLGIDERKIDSFVVHSSTKAREAFCYDFAHMSTEMKLEGDVAELGVFRGDFAKHINKAFFDKNLYLFDTFDGFDPNELKNDPANKNFLINIDHFADTCEEVVLKEMPFKEKCIIRKGFFPDTSAGLENNKFIFTNLDCDLYEPILAGLKFFVPRTIKGGVVLVHDYFNGGDGFIGVKKAVDEFVLFARKKNIPIFISPIGDSISIAIFKL